MISVSQALKTFQTENFKSIYLLLGREKFFHDQIINGLTAKLFSDPSSRSLNRLIMDGTENILPEIVAASLSFPMLSAYKLVLVKEFNRIKATDSETFFRYLENPQKTTILLLSCEEFGKTKFFTRVSEMSETIDCKPISEYKVTDWLKNRIALKGMRISVNALNMLAEYTGKSLLTIEQELQKIADFKSEDSEITEEDIISVTGMSKEYNVFTFQKALQERNFSKSYHIGKNLIDGGENLNLIISIIFSFFKKALFLTKTPQNTADLKISDYQKKEVANTLKKFDLSALEKTVLILNSSDRLIKTTAAAPIVVMQNICYNICRK